MKRIVKDPDERRRELIAAAQRLFYTTGFENTSIGDIVETVGVAKGTFYYYFESKEAVLEAIVDELVAATLTILRTITADETLPADRKWVRVFEATNRWKVGQKQEMVAMARVMLRPENVRLFHKVRTAFVPVVTAELAKIIRQGVAEGIFCTDYVEETAAHCFAVMEVLSYDIRDLFLDPGRSEDPLALSLRKAAAAEQAIEQLLNAPRDSLPVISREVLEDWFR